MKLLNSRRWFWLKERLHYPFKMYFKTLRIHPKWGWALSRGMSINTVLTTRCPFVCDDCPMFFYGEPKRYTECTFEEWIRYYNRFAYFLSQVYISGGEPSLHPDMAKIVNWLISKGTHVMLFTNLWNIEAIKQIMPHWRFLIYATYHSRDKLSRYTQAYNDLAGNYRIIGREFKDEGCHGLISTPKFTREWFENTDNTIHLSPDTPKTLTMYTGCVKLYRQ
jgi:hypothetical protein